MNQEVYDVIKAADMVLLGLGEEFDDYGLPKGNTDYKYGRKVLEEEGKLWLLPYYNKKFRNLTGLKECGNNSSMEDILKRFANCLQDKNYFVVSTALNETIAGVGWKDKRLVLPCGASDKKQCEQGCEGSIKELTSEDREAMDAYIASLLAGENMEGKDLALGVCPHCGTPMVLNNIYAEHYDESGYLPDWQLYTKWLQGTLNRKLVILELGVGMQFPSVIRFPFEKIGAINNKAEFYRVNEKLYFLSRELNGKGKAISENSIAWLDRLC